MSAIEEGGSKFIKDGIVEFKDLGIEDAVDEIQKTAKDVNDGIKKEADKLKEIQDTIEGKDWNEGDGSVKDKDKKKEKETEKKEKET